MGVEIDDEHEHFIFEEDVEIRHTRERKLKEPVRLNRA